MQNSSRSELNEKLKSPFPSPRKFGWLRIWRDESGQSFAVALLAAVLVFIVLIWLSRIVDTGLPGVPSVSIEQVVLGDSEELWEGLNESSGSASIQQARSSSTLSDVEISKPDVQAPVGQLDVQRPQSSFNASKETADVQKTVQGLSESIRKLKGEPVELGGTGGISGVLKVDSQYKTVVYVIDKSSSMATSQRLNRVKAELIAGINGLEEHQSFSVIFFDDQAWLLGSNFGIAATGSSKQFTLLPGNDREKKRATEWVNGIFPSGGTNPIPAVMLALQPKPELIVLLSDGEFHQAAVELITSSNKNSTRIDCIGLGEVVITLQSIAADNGGRYQPAR